jgi:hypothetical protein
MSNYLHSVLAGLGMFGAVYVVEHVLVGTGHESATVWDDVLLGIVAGFGLFFLLRHLETSRELRRRQHYTHVISELNHHIRNALQVILSRADLAVHSLPELEDIIGAVNRIDWALREILPREEVRTAQRRKAVRQQSG